MVWQETEETSRALKWRVFLRLQRHCLDLHYARNLVAVRRSQADRSGQSRPLFAEREFFIQPSGLNPHNHYNLLVRIHRQPTGPNPLYHCDDKVVRPRTVGA